jgi:hypothetical protein
MLRIPVPHLFQLDVIRWKQQYGNE